MDKFRRDLADDYLKIYEANVKRAKLDLENYDRLNKYLSIELEKRKLHNDDAVLKIETHQRNLFDIDLVKANFHWFQYLFNESDPSESTFNCYLCSNYLAKYYIRTPNLLARKDGVLRTRHNNNNLIQNHMNLAGHKKVQEIKLMREAIGIDMEVAAAMDVNENPDYALTNRHVRCVLFAAKKYLGFQSYPDLVELIDAAGKPMGKYCRSEKFASRMSAVMSKHFKDEFVNFLLTHDFPFSAILGIYYSFIDFLNSTLKNFSLDGSTDKSNQHGCVILLQFFNGVKVQTQFYRYTKNIFTTEGNN